jgi:hypothetical protein
MSIRILGVLFRRRFKPAPTRFPFGRITPDGALNEYATGLFCIDALATATDCRSWFVGGSNAATQQVRTFAFTARAARSR